MTKKIEVKFLNGGKFKVAGTYQGYKFDSIAIKRWSKSRIYFSAIKGNMPMIEMPKQMKFTEDGNVTISFGRKKVVIGEWREVGKPSKKKASQKSVNRKRKTPYV